MEKSFTSNRSTVRCDGGYAHVFVRRRLHVAKAAETALACPAFAVKETGRGAYFKAAIGTPSISVNVWFSPTMPQIKV
jgi:hypothetical protein